MGLLRIGVLARRSDVRSRRMEGLDIDSIVPAVDYIDDAVNVVSAVELTLRGHAIWGVAGRSTGFCKEPFFALIRTSESADSISSYQLGFADADERLGRFSSSKHIRRSDWFFPSKWMFSFSKDNSEQARMG